MNVNLSSEVPGTIQFENANENRSYPFTDNSVLVSEDGKELPENLISDLHLVVPHGLTAFLSGVRLSPHLTTVCIKFFSIEVLKGQFDFDAIRLLTVADELQQTKEEFNRLLARLKEVPHADFLRALRTALAVTVRTSDFEPYRPYRLEPLAGTEDCGGVITFGNVVLPDHPEVYRLPDFAATVCASALARYQPAKLRRIVDPRTGESVRGDVSIGFSGHILESQTADGIRLDLAEASKTALLSDCDRNRTTNVCGATPIRSINGVRYREDDPNRRIVLWFH